MGLKKKTSKSSKKVRIALIQMKAAKSPIANHKKALRQIGICVKKGAKIICLQELYRTHYFCQTEDHKQFALAEKIQCTTHDELSRLAKKYEVVIIAPVFERRTTGIYHNSALIFNADGKVAGHYRKMHIPDDPHFYEKFYFTPGDLGFHSVQTRYGKIGVLICWDQWFPEAARLTALSGAEIIFYPTAIGYAPVDKKLAKAQHTGWETIQRSHGVANGVFIAAANRVGREGKITFWGQSFVSDPFGSPIKRASATNEENLIVDCDLSQIEETRQGWPFLRDRRIDAYASITSRFIDA